MKIKFVEHEIQGLKTVTANAYGVFKHSKAKRKNIGEKTKDTKRRRKVKISLPEI